MALFYAYLKDRQSEKWNRYLITFVNRETADEWWRMISTSPNPYVGNVRRVSPQFYTADGANNVVNEFTDSPNKFPDAKQFLDRMFFTLLHVRDDRILTIAPPIKVTDHISGRWYLIRSQSDPRRHWYFRTNGACLVCNKECDTIHVSTEYRTRFCIRARNLAGQGYHAPKDFIMIGRDEISIATSEGYGLRIDDADNLKATKMPLGGVSDLLFDDLKSRFVTRAEKQEASGEKQEVGGEICELVVPVERGLGEAWELVD